MAATLAHEEIKCKSMQSLHLSIQCHVCIVRGGGAGVGIREQKIKGTTKPLMAILDISPFVCVTKEE